jgi:folate-binding protein YgfZ
VRRLAAEVAEALRIESGEPAWGAEITADYFPMEVGLSPAIDYAKGCYLGQEPIVRIRDRGHINWRLVRLHARDAAAPVPSPGDALETDARPRAGRVTSAARLPDGPAVALAVLHTSVPLGAVVRIRHGETPIPTVALEAPPTA